MTPLAPAPLLTFTRDGVPAPEPGMFRCDLGDILEHNLFVEGVTRSGKTNLVRLLVESIYGHVLVIILDPEGEYATLRTAERPFLVVGHGRDVVVAPEAHAVRRLVGAIVDKQVSTIFDLSEYEEDEQHTIVAAVCDALVALPETHPGDTLVVLDEMQEFAREGGGRDSAQPSVKRLAKRGLKRGVALAGISQRVADVANGVITQLKSKAIGGTDFADIPRALDVLGLPRREKHVLADLAQGEFFVKGPAFTRHASMVRAPRAQSSPPKRRRGEGAAPAAEAPAEIAALAQALAAAAMTEEEAPAPAAAARQKPDEDMIAAARLAGAADERARQERVLRVVCNVATATIAQLRESATVVLESASCLEGMVEEIGCGWTGVPVRTDPATPPALTSDRAVRTAGTDMQADGGAGDLVKHEYRGGFVNLAAGRASARLSVTPLADNGHAGNGHADNGHADGGLPAGEQRVLDALAELAAIGVRPATRAQVGIVASYDLGGGVGSRYVAALRRRGLIAVPATGSIELTAEGALVAATPAAPLTRQELHDRVLAKLNAGERRILEHLIAIYPDAQPRATVAAAVSYDLNGGVGSRYLSKLTTLGFAEIPTRGMLQAGAVLFPEARR